jgi:hypothetical protein
LLHPLPYTTNAAAVIPNEERNLFIEITSVFVIVSLRTIQNCRQINDFWIVRKLTMTNAEAFPNEERNLFLSPNYR